MLHHLYHVLFYLRIEYLKSFAWQSACLSHIEKMKVLIQNESTEYHGSGFKATDKPLISSVSHALDPTSAALQIQLGHKTRPLRDGGGKPSPGRLQQPSRAPAQLQELGQTIFRLVEEQRFSWPPHQVPFTASPFSSEFLGMVRGAIAELCLGLVKGNSGTAGRDQSSLLEVPKGQPFHLCLLELALRAAWDPDSHYPLVLRDGVSLGVAEDTLPAEHVWPTKVVLGGREPSTDSPALEAHENYSSAVIREDVIEHTFLEERDLNMVAGPFSPEEAAAFYECSVQELFPGLLGAVEEADKVRTTYDGSIGHQNDHIRNHMNCRNTAPTASDLQGALQWLDHISL